MKTFAESLHKLGTISFEGIPLKIPPVNLSAIDDLIEEVQLTAFPNDVYKEFDVSRHKSSNSKTTVFLVRGSDRDSDRDELAKNLKDAGIKYEIRGSSKSSFDPIFLDNFEDGQNVIFLFKPKAGGMGETTLNSSITELFPCMAWEKKHKPKSVPAFYDWLLAQDVDKFKCVAGSDKQAGKDTVAKAEDSSKFDEKMQNAIGIHKYIADENKLKPIKQVYWGYRAKPSGVPKNHPGDIFIQFKDKQILGTSLKAGGKKSTEPKLNTYVNPIFQTMKKGNQVPKLSQKLYKEVYSKIEGMPDVKTYDSKSGRKASYDVLKQLERTNKTEYERLYNVQLEIIRQTLIDLFNQSKDASMQYIKTAILRDAPDVPTKVIKGIGKSYEQVTDDDELGVFLPVVKFIKAEASKASKQNWFLHLKSNKDVIIMQMTVRTNKTGLGHKLGQFYNLSVKYNGLLKK